MGYYICLKHYVSHHNFSFILWHLFFVYLLFFFTQCIFSKFEVSWEGNVIAFENNEKSYLLYVYCNTLIFYIFRVLNDSMLYDADYVNLHL